MREQVIKLVEIIPIEFIVRNVATGSITKRLGIEDGTTLKEPLIEYCFKNDDLGDPLIAEEHIYAFEWATKKEIEKVKKMILRINDFMIGMFRGIGIKLIDFKLEFGRIKINGKNEIILADEISPDTCRLWDAVTDKKLDKDRFRKDLGDLIPAYTEVAKRLGILHEQSNVTVVNVTKLSSVKKKVNESISDYNTKKDVLDPQGKVIHQALDGMGFDNINEVRQGKYFEIDVNENDPKKAKEVIENMCKKLLANLVIEDYKIIEKQ